MSNRVPLFDALAHPTLSGEWLRPGERADFSLLVEEMRGNGFERACAIGMAGIGGYSHESFAETCRQHESLIPVAGIGPEDLAHAAETLPKLKDLGYRAIKIHPRFLGTSARVEDTLPLFVAAQTVGLPIFYCTYMHTLAEHYPPRDPFYDLVKILKECPDVKVVLVHGGDVQVLRCAELVRFNENLLLELSLTLMKYEGSSVDLDLRFLFQHFDRRICIGSDFPEYRHEDVRRRFEFFADGLSPEKANNIAHRNLAQFLDS